MTREEQSLLRLKVALRKDSQMLPSFINNERICDRECFIASKYIFDNIEKLMDMRVLASKRIISISNSSEMTLLDMSNFDASIAINYYAFYKEMLIYYMEFCLKTELYETAENIRNYYEEFYKEKYERKNG